MGNHVKGVERAEVARRLEVLAAGLRSGVVDYDDVHAPIPDLVQMALTIKDDAVEISLAWGVDARSRINPPTAEELLNMDPQPLSVEVAKRGDEATASPRE
jgi:hypothetical protein